MKSVIIGVMLLVSSVSYGAGSGDKKAPVSKKAPVIKSQDEKPVYLDMSKPDEPESEFPTITKKGSL